MSGKDSNGSARIGTGVRDIDRRWEPRLSCPSCGGSVVEDAGRPPDPDGSEGGFVESLKGLRRWAGQPSLRRLQQLGGTVRAVSGHEVPALPPSTVSSVLRRPDLPRLEFVEAFVTACLRSRD